MKDSTSSAEPFPGMSEAFEAHFAQSWIDPAWRTEASVWAACWKVATRAALAVEEPKPQAEPWQPIETAPKDGTHILVSWPMRLMDDEGMPTGDITRRDTLVTWMNGNAWIEPDYLGASGEWYGDDDCYAVDPDLWMPLPAGPALAAAPMDAGGRT